MRIAAWLAVLGLLLGPAPGWPACDPPRCFDVVVPVPRHLPTDHAADLRDVALFVATGDGTTGGPAGDLDGAPLAYLIEAAVAAMSHGFARALDAASVPHTDDFYAGGYHGWPYWQRELHWALPQIMAVITPRRGR